MVMNIIQNLFYNFHKVISFSDQQNHKFLYLNMACNYYILFDVIFPKQLISKNSLRVKLRKRP